MYRRLYLSLKSKTKFKNQDRVINKPVVVTLSILFLCWIATILYSALTLKPALESVPQLIQEPLKPHPPTALDSGVASEQIEKESESVVESDISRHATIGDYIYKIDTSKEIMKLVDRGLRKLSVMNKQNEKINTIYAYRSNSGFGWHLAMWNFVSRGLDKHNQSYTTGYLFHYKIQNLLNELPNPQTFCLNVLEKLENGNPNETNVRLQKIFDKHCRRDNTYVCEPIVVKHVVYKKTKEGELTETTKTNLWQQINKKYLEEDEELFDSIDVNTCQDVFESFTSLMESIPNCGETYIDPDTIDDLNQCQSKQQYSIIRAKMRGWKDEINRLMHENFADTRTYEVISNGAHVYFVNAYGFDDRGIIKDSKLKKEKFVLCRNTITHKDTRKQYYVMYSTYTFQESCYTIPLQIIPVDLYDTIYHPYGIYQCVVNAKLYTCKPFEYTGQTLWNRPGLGYEKQRQDLYGWGPLPKMKCTYLHIGHFFDNMFGCETETSKQKIKLLF